MAVMSLQKKEEGGVEVREYWSIGSNGEHLVLTPQRASKHELTQNLVPQEGKWPLSPCQPVDNWLGASSPPGTLRLGQGSYYSSERLKKVIQ